MVWFTKTLALDKGKLNNRENQILLNEIFIQGIFKKWDTGPQQIVGC